MTIVKSASKSKMENLQQQLAELQEENKRLREEIENSRARKRRNRKITRKALVQFGSILAGRKLKHSFTALCEELPHPSPKRVTEFSADLLVRLTKTTLIGFLVAFLPTVFLILQSALLHNQNRLIDYQNQQITNQTEKIGIQTELLESNRRSSYVFLMNNVLDQMSQELKNDWNQDGIRNLSPETIGRIIALTQAFKPYRYMEDEELIEKPLSPERGQLLVTLLASQLDTPTLSTIYAGSDFTNADLRNADLTFKYLAEIDLTGSDLSGASIYGTSFESATLNNCNFSRIRSVKSYADYDVVSAFLHDDKSVTFAVLTHDPNISDFTLTDLKNADFSRSDIVGFNFFAALLNNANFTQSRIRKCSFWQSYTGGADFDEAVFTNSFLHGFTEVENLSCTTMDSITWKTVDWHTVKDTTIPKPVIDNKNHY